jgi:Serine dehydrogenase proteinase
MPNWNDVLQEINSTKNTGAVSGVDIVRRKYLARLAAHTGRTTIAYYSGFLTKPTEATVYITDDDINSLMLCAHGVSKTDGLDLLLHTPGGEISATESFIHYLKTIFGKDIRAIVPQIAMSGGSIIACSCKSIIMGKHSNIGPCDPQVAGFPALAVKEQFKDMYDQIMAASAAADVYGPMLRQLGPSFLKECEQAIDWADDFLRLSLEDNMFAGEPDAAAKARAATDDLTSKNTRGHGKHFYIEDCRRMNLKVETLESDPDFQDLVLTVHHCYMHTLANSAAAKAVENHKGQGQFKNITSGFAMPLLNLGGPPPGGGKARNS